MKYLATFLLVCACCAAQERAAPASCPVTVGVAATDVPVQGSNHILIWYKNQSRKTIARSDFDLAFVDAAGHSYPASRNYSVLQKTDVGSGGLLVHSAQEEARHLGRTWLSIRGLEVKIRRVGFSDGTNWEAAGPACSQAFRNDDYIESMRRWNTELRLDWNRSHPNEPIPGSLLSPLLESK
jgi:hypothetical protein